MDDFDLEKAYATPKKKYSLPDFQKIAEDFEIEKLREKETNFVIREIRRSINEKFSAYLHFFETLMNPASPPMFVFTILRSLTEKDKETIKRIYKDLSRLQIESMKLDTVYSEEKEANFVKSAFEKWQELKKEILKIIEKSEEKFDEESTAKKGGYFG